MKEMVITKYVCSELSDVVMFQFQKQASVDQLLLQTPGAPSGKH